MIVKRIHSNTRIFFPDPYVLRLEYPDLNLDAAMADYRKLTRQSYKLLKGTWGYCQLEYENVKIKDGCKNTVPPSPNPFAGMNHQQIIANLFESDYVDIMRGYFCFADELDALQFRLSISANAIRVFMWPKRRFTIHEMVEIDES